MPSYFYHLKFELYPYPSSQTQQQQQNNNSSSSSSRPQPQRDIFLPPPQSSDIFDTRTWPGHPAVEFERTQRKGQKEGSDRLGAAATASQAVAAGGGGVIDCGERRADTGSGSAVSGSGTVSGSASGTGITDGSWEAVELRADTDTEALLFGRTPTQIPERDLKIAERDWRFGRVRIESLDLGGDAEMARERGESSARRLGDGRAESSAVLLQQQQQQQQQRPAGINAGLAAGGTGRVTKARYESLGEKNTEVGWGIVHLYRDGEETPALGMEIYTSREKEEEKDDYTTLCIPAVPSYFTPRDFLGFVGEKTRVMVSHFRMVMTGRTNRYLVLMKFRDGGYARKWKAEWDGKVFNSMDPETCHVMFIKCITFQTPTSQPNASFPELSHDPFTPSSSSSTSLKPFPPPTANLVELPTCPVCLERMDDTSGLLTILCQHVFHCECLQKWQGSGCPVCRHTNRPPLSLESSTITSPPFGSGEAPLCAVCDSTTHLWICLICGQVGCGRYQGAHAKQHWVESAHNFALEIETQHVWDYAGDMWVHRLIRDKGDGKLAELPSSSSPRSSDGGEGEGEDMVPAQKLERIGMEYTHLLTSQLESQRVYFEELVSKAVAKASAASAAAGSAAARAEEALSKLHVLEAENRTLREDVIVGLEKDLVREKKKAERSADVARGFGKSLMEEKKVSEGLMERIEHVNKGMMELSSQLSRVKEENGELRETNRDLLFSVSAQQKLSDMEGLEEGELEAGSVSLPPEKAKKKGKGRGK